MRLTRTGASRLGGTALAAGVLVLLVGAPLAQLLWVTVTTGFPTVREALTAPGSTGAIVGTLVVAAGVCVLAVPVGTVLAFITERARVPARTALRGALLLPLLVPEFVQGFSWRLVYGGAGFSDRVFGVTLPGLMGPIGIVLVLTVSISPLVYLVVAAALAVGAEPELERAARSSGASALGAFRTVTLPLLRVPLAAALALTFVSAVNSFAVPKVLGVPAGFGTMTTRVYSTLNLAAAPDAFAQVVVLALAMVVLVAIPVSVTDTTMGSLRRAGRTSLSAGAGPPARGTLGGVSLSLGVWMYVSLAVLVPLLGVVLAALTPAVGVAPVPANWTLANFHQAMAGEAVPALAHSLLLGVGAASLLLILGSLVVAVQRRRGGRWLGTLVTLTFAVPGSALAVAMLLAYGRWLTGSLLIILLAYLGKFWALAHRALAGAVDRLPSELVRAARVSGAGPGASLRTVIAPMLSPALAGAWALVFVFALHELTMSSLLYGPDSATLAVIVLNFAQLGYKGATAAVAVLVTLLPLVVAAPVALYAHAAAKRTRGTHP